MATASRTMSKMRYKELINRIKDGVCRRCKRDKNVLLWYVWKIFTAKCQNTRWQLNRAYPSILNYKIYPIGTVFNCTYFVPECPGFRVWNHWNVYLSDYLAIFYRRHHGYWKFSQNKINRYKSFVAHCKYFKVNFRELFDGLSRKLTL